MKNKENTNHGTTVSLTIPQVKVEDKTFYNTPKSKEEFMSSKTAYDYNDSQ